MQQINLHTFHLPVMGLAFSIDSPLKVGPYSISSVVSLSDDGLIEQMREHYSKLYHEPFTAITPDQEDYRAQRITAYLNLLHKYVTLETELIRNETFAEDSRLTKYFELLADNSPVKLHYKLMLETTDPEQKISLQNTLRTLVQAGSVDVNIMTKLDKTNYAKDGTALPAEFSDAQAALRGFALSDGVSSVVYSAGMNMRLYGYMENFEAFKWTGNGFRKKIIIKVSDYRSAAVQGKILAKKGLWVSEFRIESGLNCGGHAFATDGFLMGPILDEFKQNREALRQELFITYKAALEAKNAPVPAEVPETRLTVQGGIGTAEEQQFLLEHYGADATGWGTPFLLVPEATTVDEITLEKLVAAREKDLYLSPISPLGVPFNSLRNTTSEKLKLDRIAKGKPGSPCVKKHLVSNTEFTEQPLCTASRKYQVRKLAELKAMELEEEVYKREEAAVLAKECLCEGLANTALVVNDIKIKADRNAVAICPGPNLAYFSGIFTLQQMVDHIYGRADILNDAYRPHMFVNELKMYVSYWLKQKQEQIHQYSEKQEKYLRNFRENLLQGIAYYRGMLPALFSENTSGKFLMEEELFEAVDQLLIDENAFV